MSGGAAFECQDLGRRGRKRDNVGRPFQIWLRSCRHSILRDHKVRVGCIMPQLSRSRQQLTWAVANGIFKACFKACLLSYSNMQPFDRLGGLGYHVHS